MKDLSNGYTDNFPVSFHVFGIGEGFKSIIDKISALEYDGVSATMINAEQLPSPTDEDRMAIILVDEGIDSVIDAARSYYQAGVLTILVSHRQIEDQSKFCDAQLVADTESQYKSVKAILDMIFNNGLIALDFNDICSFLHDSGFFKVVETIGKGGDQRVAEAISKIENILTHKEKIAIENLIISIFFNSDIQPPLRMSEVKTLSDFLSSLPAEINAIWGVFHDENMSLDEIRLTTIISGKDLKPCCIESQERS